MLSGHRSLTEGYDAALDMLGLIIPIINPIKCLFKGLYRVEWPILVEVRAFNTHYTDVLVVNDVEYSGESSDAPAGVVPHGNITWQAEACLQPGGFCLGFRASGLGFRVSGLGFIGFWQLHAVQFFKSV